MKKDKTYTCMGKCKREMRVKAVSPKLAKLKLCPQCYTTMFLKPKEGME